MASSRVAFPSSKLLSTLVFSPSDKEFKAVSSLLLSCRFRTLIQKVMLPRFVNFGRRLYSAIFFSLHETRNKKEILKMKKFYRDKEFRKNENFNTKKMKGKIFSFSMTNEGKEGLPSSFSTIASLPAYM